jgi:hypothetical protein
MRCFTECQELKVYDYNSNKTTDIIECSCTGCCNNIHMFIYFLYFCSFIIISLAFCEMSSYKKKQRQILVVNEELPAYTENV